MEFIIPEGGEVPKQNVIGGAQPAGMFVVLTVKPGTEALEAVRDFCAGISDRQQVPAFRNPEAEFSCVLGIGSKLWDRLFKGQPKPRELRPLPEIKGKYTAPSTPGDILLHLRAKSMDMCFDFFTGVMQDMADFVEVEDEVQAFHASNSRNLLGFVDGTANPMQVAERTAAACVGSWDEDFAGGSYVVVQKYLHDLDKWNALSVEEQGKVIGRDKLSDIEMSDETKPANAHNAVAKVVVDGNELDIVRDNMPFGNVSKKEFGTYFIGYAAQANVTIQMIENMFIGLPEGNYDRLLDFSTAKTGGLFYCPTFDFLDDMGGREESNAVSTPDDNKTVITAASDASLNIGSLKQ